MSEAKHTTLPWKCSPSVPERGFEAQVWTADGRALLFFADDVAVGPEADANAALIVRAVNAHADLLALLTEARYYIACGCLRKVETTETEREAAAGLLAKLDGLLAKATGAN